MVDPVSRASSKSIPYGDGLVQPTLAASVVSADATPSHTNPTLELHPDIGLVVIQFWNQHGTVELSIPSQHQIDAYSADPFVPPKSADATV